jgi:hypothetical protein
MLTQQTWPSKDGIRIGYLNINSIINKLDEVSSILENSGKPFHIFCFAESRLCTKQNDTDLKIPGYNFIRLDPVLSKQTGIIVYINQSISWKQIKIFAQFGIENVSLQISIKKTQPILLCFIYRNPSELVDWFDKFTDMMETVTLSQNEIIIMGDFNIDLLKPNHRWTTTIKFFGLLKLNNKPTRITKNSETLIDHIYKNSKENIVEICSPVCGCSDHSAICLTWRKKGVKIPKPGHRIIYSRSFANFNEELFMRDLNRAPFSNIYSIVDPDEALEFWKDTFLTVYDKHAPFKSKRVKYVSKPPWLSNEILNEIRLRDNYKRNKQFDEYKSQRNKVTKLLRSSKKEYFRNLTKNSSDSKSVWKAINTLTKKNIHNNDISTKLSPNAFNEHFVNTTLSTVKVDKSSDNKLLQLEEYCNHKNIRNAFNIPFITTHDVYFYLTHLKQTNSRGLDNIDSKILKLSVAIITDSLTYLYNLCIDKSYFPTALKEAKVIPLHKAGDKENPSNYRPISILSALSKPLEKHIHKHLSYHVAKFDLLHSNQSGFRKNHSCHTSLINLVDNWLENIDNQKFSGVLFIDFAKAFDVIDHNLLLRKLVLYNCSEQSLSLLKSFLSNRHQKVFCNKTFSDLLPQMFGVPQGSILGPLLFSLFINDLPLFIDKVLCELFADDTSIHSSDSSLKNLSANLQVSINQLIEWTELNHMSLNPSKTKYMLIATRQKRQNITCNMPPLYIKNSIVEEVDQHKVLGVIIDKNLTWSPHIENLSNLLSQKLFQLNQIKHFLDVSAMKNFFFAYIQSSIDYASTLYDMSSANVLKQLVSIHRKSLKIIMNKSSISDSDYKEIGILPLHQKFLYNKAVLMYKILKCPTPNSLSIKFPINQSRYTDAINIKTPQTDIFKNSLTYSGASLWNSILKNHTIKLNSLSTFKKSYRSVLFNCI